MKIFPELWHSGSWETITYLIADKGYDYVDVKCLVTNAGKISIIPGRKNALYPGVPEKYKLLYKTRSGIERVFGRLRGC